MPSGTFRNRVNIQQRGAQPGYVQSFADWANVVSDVPASIKPVGTLKERVIADRVTGAKEYIVKFYYCSEIAAIDTNWRVVNARSSEAYNIQHVQIDERLRWVQLACEVGIDEG